MQARQQTQNQKYSEPLTAW